MFGLPHHKDPENIMSYGAVRKTFSSGQIEIIRRKARKLHNRLKKKRPKKRATVRGQ